MVNVILKRYCNFFGMSNVEKLVQFLAQWGAAKYPKSLDLHFADNELDLELTDQTVCDYVLYLAEKKYRVVTGKVLQPMVSDNAIC